MTNPSTAEHGVLPTLAGADALMLQAAGEGNPSDAGYPAGACVHDLFRAQAARTPGAVALSWRGERLTYAQLEARSNQIENALRRRGVGPEVRVGICLPRTPELVAAMLGVLKAGGAYVPLDPAYPQERLGYMLEDAAITLVITESSLADRLPRGANGVLLLDVERDAIAAESSDAPESGVGPENLSHVIFTSGSTGRPKGVMIRHSSVVVLLHWLRENVTDEERSSVLFSTSINFDVSVAEVFGTLCWGGKLVIVENALALATLDEEVVHVSMVPSAAAELLRSGGIPACVKTLNLGGEALPNALAQGLYALETVEKVGNLYGPTEDTTYSTYYVVPRGADQVLVGTPVENTQAYVLDDDLRPVPTGVIGELYLAGDGLSRGYANRPAMTAERFLPCPFGAPGARMYRVMDWVRQRTDGELEYLGRTDFQVKVRGYRIELGEIEARLAEHPGVRAPAVLVREDTPGDPRLVAYYLADEPADVVALKSHLANRLPAYMVPAAYVWMEAYPRTPNGKVDRRALPAPDADAFAAGAYEAPVGETEQAVAAIWAEVLGAERVGREDDFFELGGHSLRALRVLSRVREALGVEVPLEKLFERPVLADFAHGLETAARARTTAITPADRTAVIPPSFAQQRLWFLEQLGGTGAAYHIPMRLRLRGTLDRGALVRALDRIVARHEALRTTFPVVDGEPFQHIAPVEESAFRLVEHDLRASPSAEDELRRLAADEESAPFALARGPLIRGRLVRMAPDDHVLLLTMHHIVSDGWSTGVLYDELGALYTAFARGEGDPLPPLQVQYADYAVWHRRWVEGPVLEAQAEYWRETLAGAPELLELPTDHPRPAKQDFAGASVKVELDEALTAGLKALGARQGTTLYMTLLAGWAALLSRLSGQDEVVVGTPSANRGRSEIEGLIGFFVNTLPVRVELSGSPGVAELLGRVKERSLGAQHHQDIPFEQVVERVQPVRSLAHTPLFQAAFVWQNAPGSRMELPGLALGELDPSNSSSSSSQVKFDLSLVLWEDGDRIVGNVEYATALFERGTVERWLGYLRRVLEGMVADERGSLERLELLPDAERRRVVEEFNDRGAKDARETFVHERFAARATRTPDAVALVFEDETLSYAELNARANRLAHHLRAMGIRPETRVGICVERGMEMIVSVLAVLKAGGAYLPLDPAYPAERLRYMLEDGAPAALLTEPALRPLFADAVIPVVELGASAPAWASLPASDPERGELTADHLAYVIYTSGSTGRPKGVRVSHGSLAFTLGVAADAFGFGAGDRVPSLASFAFDIWLFETLLPLLGGGTVRLVPRERVPDVPRLVEDLASCTVLHAVPALMRRIVEEVRATPDDVLGNLRHAFVGGDAVAPDLLEEMRTAFPAAAIHVLYGPTEAAIICAAHRLGGEVAARQMVGRPLGNATLYVVELGGEVAPVGVPGELCLGGASVARDYLGRRGLTAERFIPDPFSSESGARLYRTGDRVRWLADGSVEFLGRTDHQVKIRGFRIEPGEIEARLAEHAGVREAVVLVREDTPGEKRLVAYVAGDETAGADVLRAHLSERLPEYMVPAAYVRLDALPLTPNGKVDRKALPAPAGDAVPARGYEAPCGKAEEAVAAIWAELLGAERVGRRDHFFELGGHSLLAVRVVSRVRQALGVDALPRDVFERPVLADFARGVQASAPAETAAIERVNRAGPLALSFAQQRLWFLEQLGEMGSTYHIASGLRLKGELDRDALAGALNRIVARHEALRTTFAEVNGVPEQRIAPAEGSGFHLVEHDLRGEPEALDRVMADEGTARFDLGRGPLIRGRLIQLGADDHVLLITMHHIVSDGWSAGVLHGELSALYAAFRDGEPDPLPELPVQYADYAAWQRGWVEGELLERQARYWERALAGAPELLELPADHPRPAKQDFAGESVEVELDEALAAGLKALSRRHGATLFMTLLAGWATVLARLSGQDDVVVGTPSANRGQREIEELIGFFVNTLPVRVDLAGSPSVAEVLARVKVQALEAQQNQDIPFEQVVERVQPTRSLAHTPLFQVMFGWENEPDENLALPGLHVGAGLGPAYETAKFDLTLSLGETGGRIVGSLEYATALFERATVERHVGYLRRVLEQMAADDARAVDTLELLPAAERRLVVDEWNRTDADLPAAPAHRRFEAQVEKTPGATAVVSGAESLTYAELDARANRLARWLIGRGVGAEVRVGLCLERGPEMVIAVLGVLKAGGAWVPLDPSYPAERLAYMAADSALPIVLTQERLLGRLPFDENVEVVALDARWGEIETEDATDLAVSVDPRSLAYVLYTSGSTGRPKGVAVEHAQLGAYLAWATRSYPGGGSALHSPLSFDLTVTSLFVPLLNGGVVELVEEGDAVEGLARVLERGGREMLKLTPAHLRVLGERLAERGAVGGAACLVIGGEPLVGEQIGFWIRQLPDTVIVNEYGPTETVVGCSIHSQRLAETGAGQVPIGRPVPNTRLYVLDTRGAPVPVGVPGELYVGGAQVTRGYLGRPGLTAERFVPDPFSPGAGARMYRTGDQVRWLADGTLEFLGRTDFQVKIRGFRIELGEIEAALRSHDAVRDALVLAREDAPGDRRLVAYVVGEAEVEALRDSLRQTLPEHMVPAVYVRLDALPLTPNGKVDRRALPAPGADAFAARAYEPPVGESESVLAGIWSELLGVERVGRGDHFFALGGHSLLAVRVVSRVRQALGVEASPAGLFERPVLADFARGLETAARTEATAIPPVDRAAPIPLSFAQQRLWFLEQLGDMGSTYHIPSGLRLKGELDRDALVRALDRIVARHEVLRTTFAEVDGVPEQRISPAEASGLHLVEHDLSGRADAEAELDRWLDAEARAPFDRERGPLVRGRLIRLAADDHVLLITMHHIVSDGWSTGVLHGELSALYAAFREGEPDTLPDLPVQYADYAAWQRGWVEGELLERQARYWERVFAGAPELLELPTDHPRPAKQDFAGGSVDVELDEALTAALKTLSQRHGATLFMTLLAGWATVLARLSGQDDVVVGTPSANRGRREIEELIGFFVNTLPVRVDLSGGAAVAEVLAQVKARALEAQQNQDIPFEQVVERVQPARSLAYTPLFQVMFGWQNEPDESLALPGLHAGAVPGPAHETAKFDLTLTLGESGDRIVGGLSYATALFERATVERWSGYLRRVLEEMAADDAKPVERLGLLSAAERRRVVVEWNATGAAFPAGACIHDLFETQAARTPGAVAVVFGDAALTYDDLNRRANRLAHHLRALGVGPGSRVAICVERGPEMIAGLLAILKAGGAYVPLDPAYPADRLRYMLEDSAPAALVTQSPLAGTFAGLDVPAVELDASAWAEGPETNPPRAGLTSHHLAYVIYTSGSTGRPKGVMVEHRSLVNHTAWQAAAFGIGAGDTVLQRTSISFDASVWELWTPLATGARMRLLSSAAAKDPEAIGRVMAEGGVTVAQFVPTLLQAVLGARPAGAPLSCRVLFCGGEPLPAALVEEARAAGVGEVVNLYGPTEATIDSTSHVCTPDGRTPAIGRPIANARIYVLDALGVPAPVGVAGELYVGGAGVARGYLDRPELTAERFVADPFSEEGGARMYRTGDRSRWKADGTLEFLGRLDQQVKIRGFRVEPGEIEAALREHPSVRASAVTAREDMPGDRRLVAYVVGDVDADALRAHLRRSLPEHMVPAAFVQVDALPLTPGGKLDRRALPAPDPAVAEAAFVEPRTPDEAALAAIWAEVLGRERVGVSDNFFHLGGHSLLAARAAMRVRERLDGGVAVVSLFEHPTVERFAAFLAARALVAVDDSPHRPQVTSSVAALGDRLELPPIERAARGGRLPLSFAQERLWFIDRLQPGRAVYNIPVAWRLEGALDEAALERALGEIVRRHEALRTTVGEVHGSPVQVIAPFGGFSLPVEDLSGLAEADREAAVRHRAGEEARRAFDLLAGPLFRAALLRLDAEDHLLLLSMHHIVSDGWSLGVLYRELSALYATNREGGESPLSELPVQYADYVLWQREQIVEAQGEYWRATLEGAPELLELPTDRPRPPRQDFTGTSLRIELDEALTAALRTLGERHGTTLYMTVLAGWAAVLSRLSGQDDVVIGTPTANRGRSEIEGLIGFFANTLALRVDVSGAPTVAELLRRVRQRALEAQRYQDFPFEQVVERVRPVRSLSHTPLFQVVLAWQEALGGELELPGIAATPLDGVEKGAAPFDLMLGLAPRGGRIVGDVLYATALFDRATVERYVGYLRCVLEEMAADDAKPVSRLELIGSAERARLLALGEGAAPGLPRATVDALFARAAAAAPEAVALAWAGGRMTYAELDDRANRLAHHLRRAGVAAGTRVGVCLERGPAMVVATLAALKAGGAYVPLDPSYPAERLAFMLADTAVPVLVTKSSLADRLPPHAARIVRIDTDAAAIAAEPADPPAIAADPEAAAYVMYTSGSTGRPKGVEVPHRAIVRLVRGQDYVSIDPSDVFLQLAPASFDAATLELWGPLLNGARLAIHPAGPVSVESIGWALAEHGVTVLWLTAGLFQLVVEEGIDILRGVRQLLAGGDVLSVPHVRRVLAELPETALINGYGPTENTTFTCCHRISGAPRERASIPVGRPIANTYVRVLDAGMRPAPVGVPGELYAGGAGLALGYLNRPALTAETFVPDPFAAGARLYRTGDRVRWRADGTVEFLGRVDTQVKIRGFRIEPGEIEARLLEHAGVREAVVLAREDAPGKKRLVAYVVGEAEAEAEALRAHLDACLPAYMVPAAYVRLEALPLTSNGKLDRGALPVPDGAAYARRGHEPPGNLTEYVLAGIWTELLGVERVGRRDHFFDLGGHSLLAVRMVGRVREALNPAATVEDVFTHPVLCELAVRLEEGGGWFGTNHAIPLRQTGSERPLFLSHDGWGIVFYGQALRPHLDAEIPVYALPGPLNDIDEPGSMDDLVTRLVRMITEVQPEGPYRLAGWSAGGVFAYAVAERLIEMGRAVEFLGLLDTAAPATLPDRHLPRAGLFNVLDMLARDSGMTPATPEALQALREDTEGLELPAFIAVCKARGLLPETVTVARAEQVQTRMALLNRTYAEFVPRPLPVSVHLFVCDNEEGDSRRGWRDLQGGAPFRVERAPGTHHTMWKKGNVEGLGAAISRAIRASAAGGD